MTEFDAAARDFLRSRPVHHTVQLTVCARLRQQGPGAFGDGAPEFGWWTGAHGAVTGALVRTPPHHLLLTELPTRALAPLVDLYAAADPALPGVAGPVATAEAFGAAWQRATRARPTVARGERLYRLGELAPPPPARGQGGRVAGPDDRALLVEWWTRFAQVIGEPQPYRADRAVDDRLGYGGVSLWEDGGRPVSLAGATRQVAGTVRIGPVFTPEPSRGRGYASQVTSLVRRRALDAGAREVLLFTDLANSTSNALYQRLGFRPVGDFRTMRLAP
ncbi:GNAT family N-acetyltransferase [Streptantibioticus rubrisoli]|uniref:GNAT family N-acetyltransferase n=1 Tax=Streptantibioticus rubrisoli TaxID=1387313 RepID=UPI0027E33ABA|nr:GNAT family N-acetyltransferase [Streptantibioticus rubrisoli]